MPYLSEAARPISSSFAHLHQPLVLFSASYYAFIGAYIFIDDEPECPEYTQTFNAELAIISAQGPDFLRAFTWGMLVDAKLKSGGDTIRGVCLGFPEAETDAFLFSKVSTSSEDVTLKDIVTMKFVCATPVFEINSNPLLGLCPV
jgi:hypothetical protein